MSKVKLQEGKSEEDFLKNINLVYSYYNKHRIKDRLYWMTEEDILQDLLCIAWKCYCK